MDEETFDDGKKIHWPELWQGCVCISLHRLDVSLPEFVVVAAGRDLWNYSFHFFTCSFSLAQCSVQMQPFLPIETPNWSWPTIHSANSKRLTWYCLKWSFYLIRSRTESFQWLRMDESRSGGWSDGSERNQATKKLFALPIKSERVCSRQTVILEQTVSADLILDMLVRPSVCLSDTENLSFSSCCLQTCLQVTAVNSSIRWCVLCLMGAAPFTLARNSFSMTNMIHRRLSLNQFSMDWFSSQFI